MNAMPPGWYPDPEGGPSRRYFDGTQWTAHVEVADTPRPRRLPGWGWALIGVGAVLLVMCAVVGVRAVNRTVPRADPGIRTTAIAAHSAIMPDLTFPEGTTRLGGVPTGPNEFWDVPAAYSDAVAALRRELPVGKSYDGLRWCAEETWNDELTVWSWGSESDYLSVMVTPAAAGPGSEVSLDRGPDRAGCRR